jgi:hypothetical protein
MNRNMKVEVQGDEVICSGPCYVTKKPFTVTVKKRDFDAWVGGEFAQRAFPYLSADQREFLISGTSPEGWKQLFGDPNDEDATITEEGVKILKAREHPKK